MARNRELLRTPPLTLRGSFGSFPAWATRDGRELACARGLATHFSIPKGKRIELVVRASPTAQSVPFMWDGYVVWLDGAPYTTTEAADVLLKGNVRRGLRCHLAVEYLP